MKLIKHQWYDYRETEIGEEISKLYDDDDHGEVVYEIHIPLMQWL